MMELNKKEDSVSHGLKNGLISALIPHIGCFAFIVLTLLGITVGATFFKKFLLARWSFPVLILLSFLLAGISSFFYLKKNCCANKAKYIGILFISVLFVNGFLFYGIFPLMTNISTLGGGEVIANLQELKIKVAIPCTGHAPLITDELKKAGAGEISFSVPDVFDIKFDSQKVSREELLGLVILQEFKATEIN